MPSLPKNKNNALFNKIVFSKNFFHLFLCVEDIDPKIPLYTDDKEFNEKVEYICSVIY